MGTKKELLEYEDDLNRFYAQTEGIIVALTIGSPDNIGDVPSNVIFDVLWLIQNRLEDIKSTADKIAGIAKEGVK